MEKEQRQTAGVSTRRMAARRGCRAFLYALGGFLISIILLFIFQSRKTASFSPLKTIVSFLILFLSMIFASFFVKKALVASREEERADRGAAAEEQIGEILDGLGEGFEVIHDIETPYGNIDHLVIGQRCGIVLIETKSHHGKVSARGDQLLVNGRLPEKDFIRQSLRNTYWLRQVVEFVTKNNAWITPVIVFTNAFVEVSGTIKGVHVVNARYLERFLHSHTEADTSVWEAKEEIKSLLVPHVREDPSVCIYQG